MHVPAMNPVAVCRVVVAVGVAAVMPVQDWRRHLCYGRNRRDDRHRCRDDRRRWGWWCSRGCASGNKRDDSQNQQSIHGPLLR
jgi:hypothetical protein